MLTRVKQLLSPPIFTDKEKTHQAKLLNFIVLAVVIIVLIPAFMIFIAPSMVLAGLAPIIMLWLVGIVVLVILQKGFVKQASLLFLGGAWIIIVCTSIFFGGVQSNAFNFLIIVVLLASLLLNWQTSIGFAGLSIVVGLGLLYLELNGILPPTLEINTPITIWTNKVLIFIFAMVIIYVFTSNINKHRTYLEQLITQRTAELEETNQQLHLEISKHKQTTRKLQDQHNLAIQSEQELRTSEVLYKAIIKDQTEFVTRFTPDFILTFANDAYWRYFNQKEKEAIGRKFQGRIPTEDQEKLQALLASLTPQNPVGVIEHRSIIDDQIYWQYWSNRVVFDSNGKVTEYLAIGRDITERKQAEKALRASEARFRRAINSISDHIYMTEVTAEGHHINLYISPNITELTGYPLENFTADRYFWPTVVIHSEDRPIAEAQSDKLDTGQNSETEYRMIKENGTVIWVRDSARVESQGTSKIVYGVVSDITENKRLEEQLRQSQKLEAIGQLAGGVAHDFNNILTVITGTCDIMLLDTEKDHPLYPDLEQVKQAATQAASLTHQLLAFSRQQVLQPIVLYLNEILTNNTKILQRLIGENIELITLPEVELGCIKADPSQMEQILLNLAVNARDAMPKGGKLTIETKNVYLDETYTQHHVDVEIGPHIMLAVSDTGEGIDSMVQEHIFEPFFTTKEQGKGTGLGLATVHGIVKQSNGHIWVYSEPNQGTTFKIYLPEVEATGSKLASSNNNVSQLLPSEGTILLVEDENMVRNLAHRILVRNGYSVLEALNGQAALKISEGYKGKIDLLLTDVIMPGGMSGRQLVEHITPQRPEMRIIYMSGYTDNAIVNHGILDSDAAFIQKPFTPDHLAKKIREVLDQA